VLLFFREQFKDMVSPPPGSQIGLIAAIYCYPIQSCGGVSLQEAQITSTGIKYDRQWAVVPANGVTPFTLKSHPALSRVMTAIENGDVVVSADGQRPVRFPLSSKAQEVGDNVNKWFSDFLGVPAKVVRVQQGGGDGDKSGYSDSSTGVLIVSEQSCTDLNTKIENAQIMQESKGMDSKSTGTAVLSFGHMRPIDVKQKPIAAEGVLPDGKVGDVYVKSKELGILKTKQWNASYDSLGRVKIETSTVGFTFSSKAFRPNVVVMGGEGLTAFSEDTWKNVRFMGSGGPKLSLSFLNNNRRGECDRWESRSGADEDSHVISQSRQSERCGLIARRRGAARRHLRSSTHWYHSGAGRCGCYRLPH